MKKICILTDQHLSANPRVWKEANSLSRAGYVVVILTAFSSAEHKRKDELLLKDLDKNIRYRSVINLIRGEVFFPKLFFYKARLKFAEL